MTNQTSIIPSLASPSYSALSNNSRAASQSGSLEQQFLAMIESSLSQLGLSKEQVEVHLEGATVASSPKPANQRLVISITGTPSTEARQAASTPTAAAAQPSEAGGNFLTSFRPEYEPAKSNIVDVSGKTVGTVPLCQHHFATAATAELLAQQLGAKVVEQGATGRDIPERALQFSEGGELLNAGLVAHAFEMALQRGESMETVIQRLQAELYRAG